MSFEIRITRDYSSICAFQLDTNLDLIFLLNFRGYEDFPLPEPSGTTYKDIYKNIEEEFRFKKEILKNIKKESIVSISSWKIRQIKSLKDINFWLIVCDS